jgi:hypothetical protein
MEVTILNMGAILRGILTSFKSKFYDEDGCSERGRRAVLAGIAESGAAMWVSPHDLSLAKLHCLVCSFSPVVRTCGF